MSEEVSNNIGAYISKRYKGLWITILKIVIAGGLLTYLVFKVDVSEIMGALRNANITLIVITALLAFLNIYLQFLKWKITCSYILNEKNNKKILLSLFYGFSGGFLLPQESGNILGEQPHSRINH